MTSVPSVNPKKIEIMRITSTTENRPGARHAAWRTALLGAAIAVGTVASAQVLFNETFTGGTSSEGFTVDQEVGTCGWVFNNPGSRTITGASFDADFAIFDSDNCGSAGGDATASLLSPTFDASTAGNYMLSFSQQYRYCCSSVATVDVWDGSVWNNVYTLPASASVGYPGSALPYSVNITAATGGSSAAQVRFRYNGDWAYWWALDNINLEIVACSAPADLAVTAITTSGGTIGWTDNGSTGYEWAVTTGAAPDGSNEVATGDGSNMTISGLQSGTAYTAWVRSDCGDGSFSTWSNGVAFITGIANDNCSGAIALTVNPDYSCAATTQGTVAGATASGVSSSCGGTADDDVWYSVTATNASHTFNLSYVSGSTGDMYMALWSGDCGTLALVPNTCSDPESMTATGLTPGNTYYLQVYTWTSTAGQTSVFNVCVGTPPPPPANDDCAGAVALTVNANYNCAAVTNATIAGATGSGVTSTCGGTADDDVWFTFVATDDMHRISLDNFTSGTSDMYMSLWTGSCGTLVQVPGSCSDPESMDVTGLAPGTTYYLQVYTWTSSGGQTSTFDVCVGSEPFCQPPANVMEDSFVAPDASVSWDENGAMEYQYELRTEGAPGSGATGLEQSGIVTASPLALTGLAEDVLYTLYVRSICSVGDTSAWSGGTAILDGYCLSNFTNVTYEFVTNVTLEEINNTSAASIGGPVDYTDMEATVARNSTYPLSVTIDADALEYVYAFIDWNQNKVLDDAGEVYTLASSTNLAGPHTLDITVPADAVLGNTRMRAMVAYNNATPDPCVVQTYGEAEDYTLEVTLGTAITALSGEVFSVYPNPARTELFINGTKPVHVKVYDMVGHLAMEQHQVTRLNVANLAPGSYSLLITDDKGNVEGRARFVKQ